MPQGHPPCVSYYIAFKIKGTVFDWIFCHKNRQKIKYSTSLMNNKNRVGDKREHGGAPPLLLDFNYQYFYIPKRSSPNLALRIKN